MEKTRKCIKCSEVKPIEKYNRDGSSRNGRRSSCRKCEADRKKKYYRTRKGLVAFIYNDQRKTSRNRKHPYPEYTIEELRLWVFSQDNFEKLYKDWVDDGYSRNKKPSCDRLDDYKGYSLDNIRLVTWRENMEKSWSDIKNGINNKQSKVVVQYTMSGEYIAEYHSISNAKIITGINHISGACIGHISHAGGYIWKYKD